jgi:opacity protein-like surface antigen
MKKFVIAAVAAAALNTVSAQSCASSFSGFYAGLQAGMNATVSSSAKLDTTVAGNPHSVKGSRGSQSFIGGLFLGYGMGVGSCAYVGAELYGNFTNDKTTLFDNSDANAASKLFTTSAKNNGNFGAKIRLGYTVSQQAMIFLGLGLEYAQWQLKAENILDGAQAGVERVTKKNKRSVAFAPSVGMEMFMTKNLFVRGEYTYVATGSQKIEAQFRTAPGAAGLQTATFKSNVNQHRFALGLGYKF